MPKFITFKSEDEQVIPAGPVPAPNFPLPSAQSMVTTALRLGSAIFLAIGITPGPRKSIFNKNTAVSAGLVGISILTDPNSGK